MYHAGAIRELVRKIRILNDKNSGILPQRSRGETDPNRGMLPSCGGRSWEPLQLKRAG
jgi:hypothetical protein